MNKMTNLKLSRLNFLYFLSIIPFKRREKFKNAEIIKSAKDLLKIWRKPKNRCKNRNINEEIEIENREENQTVKKEENDSTDTEKEINNANEKTD